MPTPEDIAQLLYRRTTKGIKLELDRMLKAAEAVGNPHNAYASIHVAGTNGKGSACAFIESVLRTSGHKTGLFTSPHIRRFEERFIVDGKPVPGRQWMGVYRDLEKAIDQFHLTFFEAATLIAFELFKREQVTWAVIETGMGGKLDATNIIVPKASAITSIAMDHMQHLGNDLVSIAREKLGIVKKNLPLVVMRPGQPDIEVLIKKHCADVGAPCFFVLKDDAVDYATDGYGSSFTYLDQRFTTILPCEFQRGNVMVALKTLEAAGFNDYSLMKKGIASAFIPGRFQMIKMRERTFVFDVGHNPAAAEELVKALRRQFPDSSICIVAGIMKDKDLPGILKQYCSVASHLILTQPDVDRAAEAAILLKHVPEGFKRSCEMIRAVSGAVVAALKSRHDVICVTGSFYTVGEAMTALDIEPYGKK